MRYSAHTLVSAPDLQPSGSGPVGSVAAYFCPVQGRPLYPTRSFPARPVFTFRLHLRRGFVGIPHMSGGVGQLGSLRRVSFSLV